MLTEAERFRTSLDDYTVELQVVPTHEVMVAISSDDDSRDLVKHTVRRRTTVADGVTDPNVHGRTGTRLRP